MIKPRSPQRDKIKRKSPQNMVMSAVMNAAKMKLRILNKPRLEI